MTRNPVGWFEIYVQDMDRAKRFYEGVLKVGLQRLPSPTPETTPDMEMWAFPMTVDAVGASGALVKMEGVPSGAGGTLVYFSCADCAVEAGRIAAAGGHVQKEKTSIFPYGFIALATDAEGNMFGLHSPA